jgi:hypothetical protein
VCLRDRNGTELYRGDLVCSIITNQIYIVEFDIIFGIRFLNKAGYYIMPLNPVNKPQRNIELVGNIYDNPEAMKGEVSRLVK